MSWHNITLVKAHLVVGALLLGASSVLAGAGWQTPQTPRPLPQAHAPAPAVVQAAPARWTVSVSVGSPAAAPEPVVLHPGESVTISWQQPTTHATASRTHTAHALP